MGEGLLEGTQERARSDPGSDPRRRLVLASFLMLFLELALIRWVGANIVYLSYFSNFVLLGSFLGIGVGLLRAERAKDLFPWLAPSLAALVVFIRISPVHIDKATDDVLYFGLPVLRGLPPWAMLPVVFLVVAFVMMIVGETVGRVFRLFEPLEAYRLDIVGSLLGIAAFSVLAFLRAPSIVWGAVVVAVIVGLAGRRGTLLQGVAAVCVIAALLHETLVPGTSWSPYYKITSEARTDGPDRYVEIFANGIPHQLVTSATYRQRVQPFYFLPYERIGTKPLDDVLVVGAGNGTDVAIALAHGARHVDAVEIDPRIYEIGREIHPNDPYADPRVRVHIADGRAFLERSSARYDLILFALPDSLTLVTGASSVRLESYLFTIEGIREARRHVKPGGFFAMYNYYGVDWLVDRYATTLHRAFGRPPCVDRLGRPGGGLAVIVASADTPIESCPSIWDARGALGPATDDHPFPYLRTRGIPPIYAASIGLILVASILLVRGGAGSLRPMTGYVDLFFMGAAFLLLETKSVVQFALLFGTTWFVNALVFAGILLSVLAAVEVARRGFLPARRTAYALLIGSLAVAAAVPVHTLLSFTPAARFVVAVVLTFTPIFLANLVFAERFRGVGSSTVALGANLLGAMIGGLLEYGSLVVGYRVLLGVVAVLYGLAFVTSRERGVAPAA